MSPERRYSEEEVQRIFEVAASERSLDAGSPGREGHTLAELQAIGEQVGLPPDRIAEAAAALDRQGTLPARRTALGLPISVGRTYSLPRPPTDHEWEILVAELRHTFAAQGSETSTGNLRQWRNGNLFAAIEPDREGYRLRMGTRKSSAIPFTIIGAGWLVLAAVIVLQILLGPETGLADAIFPALVGAGFLGANYFQLPRWAAERESQMEYIGSRTYELLGPTGATSPDASRLKTED